MSKRKSLSKKLRFEVFKRDSFSCQYCGKMPPDITLEIDHVTPVSRGGENDINNLITACFDCNRGKSNIKLDTLPNTIQENHNILKEKELQFYEYEKLLRKIKRKSILDANKINDIYSSYFTEYCLTEAFKNSTIKMFLKKLPYSKVEEAMEVACSRISDSDKAIKYFCGICWNMIKGNTYD